MLLTPSNQNEFKSSPAAHSRSAKIVITSVKSLCSSFEGEKSKQAIEDEAEITKEVQETTEFRGFLQEAYFEIDLFLKEYARNEQPEQGELQWLSTPQLLLHFQANSQV